MSASRTGRSSATGTELKAGEVFAGRYTVVSLLGRGGMGAVYQVEDDELGEAVALKLLQPGADELEKLVARFRREVRLARRITHRNVARTFDLGESEGVRFLTMEYVVGRSLAQIIKPHRALSLELAAGIGRQIAQGLEAAHAAGVVHRDLTPANVLVEDTGRVVLTDFGIARAVSGEVTITGKSIGTPAYMSPEQVAGGEVSPFTDVYSLGLILFRMLSGELPFTSASPIAAAVARLHGAPPEPTRLAHVPEAIAKLTVACLSREPDQRPAVKQIESELGRVAADEAEIGQETQLGPTAMPPSEEETHLSTEVSLSGERSAPTFAITSPGDRVVGVLPFHYRGPDAEAYLADALTDELIDLLSMTRGLRVSGSGATTKYRGERDPRTVGEDLGIDLVVEGTLQRSGPRIRISARLVEVQSGFQLWSERFEGVLEDVFDMQDRMGKRIAEALRVELETISHRGDASAEAIELYLRARHQARLFNYGGADGTTALLEEAIELAPDFTPAISAYALACVRAWFMPDSDSTRDWEHQARAAVDQALERAPEVAETNLAAAIFAAQFGDYRSAAHVLSRALKIAPTYAAAHEYLGRLQCEAGRAKEGARHLQVAADLDPSVTVPVSELARYHALRGDYDAFESCLAAAKQAGDEEQTNLILLEIRVAGWKGDLERVRACVARLPERQSEIRGFVGAVGEIIAGDMSEEQAREVLDERIARAGQNKRFQALALQLAAEVAGLRGFDASALAYVLQAVDGVLVDLDWLDRCPALAGIRGHDEFRRACHRVRTRAESIWSW